MRAAEAATVPATDDTGSLDPTTWLQDLWVLRADGSASRNLTVGVETSVDYDFAWSPESSAIAFGVFTSKYGSTRMIFTFCRFIS